MFNIYQLSIYWFLASYTLSLLPKKLPAFASKLKNVDWLSWEILPGYFYTCYAYFCIGIAFSENYKILLKISGNKQYCSSNDLNWIVFVFMVRNSSPYF